VSSSAGMTKVDLLQIRPSNRQPHQEALSMKRLLRNYAGIQPYEIIHGSVKAPGRLR